MRKLYTSVSPAVYKINTSSGSGSGFYLKDKNIVVTNYHVIAGNRKVSLEDQNRDRYLAHVVFVNADTDLAFLRPEAPLDAPLMELAPEGRLHSGDQVHVLGFPFGMPFTITAGIVSSTRQLIEGKHYIQTDAAVNPGNSGGPVVDEQAQVVGVTTSKFTNADNVGFAIPLEIVSAELSALEENPDDKYAVRCHSCSNLIFVATEYCPVCGATIEEELFQETHLNPFAEFVEGALRGLGMDPVLARAGNDFWIFHQGSSQIFIGVYQQHYLYASSPLNRLPRKKLPELYRYLLSDPMPPYSLSISDNQIYLSYRAHISEVFSPLAEQIKQELAALPLKADEMDNFFVDEFGAAMTNYSKEE